MATTQKGAQRMKKVFIHIPEELHTAAKMAAASERTTLKDYIAEALMEKVQKGGSKGKK
jgi:predicted HicB family RNase H-like nuclease